MAEDSLITPEMRDAVGVESEPWRVEVDKTAIRMFARAVGYTDPVFYDEDVAKARGYRSLPAPPHYLGTPVYDPRNSDPTFGAPRRGRSIESGLKRRLNGGTEIEYFGDIVAGDVLTASSQIAEVVERQGSIGRMLITTTETTYTNQDGRVVAKSRGTGIQY
jgi:acyl dehydratase